MTIQDAITALFIILGTGLILSASVGLVKMPDFFCRTHALGNAMTLGITFILLGAWIAMGTGSVGFKIAVAIVFQLMTIPVSSHILGKVAYLKKIPRWKHREILK